MNYDYREIRNNLIETYNRNAIERAKRRQTPTGGGEMLDRFIALMKEQNKKRYWTLEQVTGWIVLISKAKESL